MSRRRMIHEGFWTSRNNLYWTLRQRLLFAGLFSLADDQGRLEGHPALVRGMVFPYDDFTTDDIAEDLKAIETRGCIILYETDGREYIQVVTWWEHQPMQWAKPSEMPAPEGWTDKVRYRHDNDILSCNWTTPQGNAVPDNCDVKGKRIGNRLPKDLPEPLPIPPEIRSSDKSNSNSKSKDNTRAAEKKSAGADSPKRLDQQMWDALVEVCHVKYISKKMRGTLNSTIPVLVSMGLSPPDIRCYAKWYENDWHKANAPLHLGILEKGIGAWLDLGKPASRATQNGSKDDERDRTYEHEVMDKDTFRAALSEVQGRGVPVQPVRAGDGLENGVDALPGVRAGPSG